MTTMTRMGQAIRPPHAAELKERYSRLRALALTEPAKAHTQLQSIVHEAQTLGNRQVEAGALLTMSSCDFYMGRYKQQLEFALRAVEISTAINDMQILVRAYIGTGLALYRLGCIEECLSYFLGSLRLAVQINNQFAICRAIGSLAMLCHSIGDLKAAMKFHERALVLARSLESNPLTADMLGGSAEDWYYAGNYDKALLAAQEALHFTRSGGMPRFECYSRATLARALIRLGRCTAAVRMARCGIRIARWAEDIESITNMLRAEGEALIGIGDYDRALMKLREATDISAGSRHAFGEYMGHALLAEVYEATGDKDRAAEERRLSAKFDQGITPRWALRTYMDHEILKPVDDTGALHDGAWIDEMTQLTEPFAQASRDLSERVTRDETTGALSRQQLQAIIQSNIDILGPEEIYGVIFIGFDKGRSLRDGLGAHVANETLRMAAERVMAILRTGDVVGRVHQDVLAAGLPHMASPQDLHLVKEKVTAELRQPFFVGAQTVYLDPHVVGIVAPRDGDSVDVMFERLDGSLHCSQRIVDVRDTEPRVTRQNNAKAANAPSLAVGLRSALDDNEFELYYQGQFDVSDRSLKGFEALVRWKHPHYGTISPSRFIPVAEESRQMLDVGDWVLRQACRQAVAWDLHGRGKSLSVNISPLQFMQPDFVVGVRSAMDAAGVPPDVLTIELTESLMMTDQSLAKSHSEQLADYGVRLAMDDFGMGFSNLALLKNLPFNELKIDRSLLTNVDAESEAGSRARALLEMIANLTHGFGLSTVAEGVETESQMELLRTLGFDTAQGFWLCKPLDVVRAGHMLDAAPVGAVD